MVPIKLVSSRFKFLVSTLFLIGFSCGCAHTYYYLPEVAGAGEKQGEKGGVVYSIPPTGRTDFTIQVRSLGIRKAHHVQMIGLRMYFVRGVKGQGGNEFIDPSDLFVKLWSGQKIKPAFIHSKAKDKSLIVLNGVEYEMVELLFPLPLVDKGAVDVGIFYFHWTVHYGEGKIEEKITSFDRYDSAPKEGVQPYQEDINYPYPISPVQFDEWHLVNDPYWWSYDPWWLWE